VLLSDAALPDGFRSAVALGLEWSAGAIPGFRQDGCAVIGLEVLW
jgi:hypothetical protein